MDHYGRLYIKLALLVIAAAALLLLISPYQEREQEIPVVSEQYETTILPPLEGPPPEIPTETPPETPAPAITPPASSLKNPASGPDIVLVPVSPTDNTTDVS